VSDLKLCLCIRCLDRLFRRSATVLIVKPPQVTKWHYS